MKLPGSRVLAVLAVGAVVVLGPGAPAAFATPVHGPSGTRVAAWQWVSGELTSSYQWTLAKSGQPDSPQVPVGDSGSVHWTITATRSATAATDAAVAGRACVRNDGHAPTQGLAIGETLGRGFRLLATVSVDVSAIPVLAPGETACYPYRLPVPAPAIQPGALYWILGHVTIDNGLGEPHTDGPFLFDAARLPGSPTEMNASVTVGDTNGRTFTFDDSGSVGYDQPVDCPSADGPQTLALPNTATIDQTGQSATATATVSCMAPTSVTTQLSASSVQTGVPVSDQATIGGAPTGAGGSITYAVYDNPTCTGTPVADATPADATVTDGTAPASDPISFDTPGSYYWQAVYSGDPTTNTLASHSDCGSEPLTVTAPSCTHGTPGCPWQDGDLLTYTQVNWPTDGNSLLVANFDAVYASTGGDFVIGIPGGSASNPPFSLVFTNAEHLASFLPQVGSPAPLNDTQVNPTGSNAGAFAGSVAALELDVDYADADLLPGSSPVGFGDLHVCGLTETPDLNGLTVRQFLPIALTWLGGGGGPDDVSSIADLASNLTVSFGGGAPNAFAQDHLFSGACT